MRRGGILAAALWLAGCDDPTVITHVDKLSHMRMNDLWTMQDAQGLPVEIHGAPFAGVSDREIAEAIRPPAGSAQEVRFYAVPPGSRQGGHPWRLVLHFNAQGAPNARADCRLLSEARTDPPPAGRFSVNASFCNGPTGRRTASSVRWRSRTATWPPSPR